MKIIKRNGAEVEFDPVKIENALIKANDAIDIKSKRITKKLIKLITEEISESYINAKRTRSVEYIQDQIEILDNRIDQLEILRNRAENSKDDDKEISNLSIFQYRAFNLEGLF